MASRVTSLSPTLSSFYFFHFSSCWSFVKLFSFVLVSYLFLQSFQSLKVLFHPATSQRFCQFVASILVSFVCLSDAGRTGDITKQIFQTKASSFLIWDAQSEDDWLSFVLLWSFFFKSKQKTSHQNIHVRKVFIYNTYSSGPFEKKKLPRSYRDIVL